MSFGRADENNPKSAVVEAAWGNEWYTNEKYTGPKTLALPKEWNSYVGYYRNRDYEIDFHIVSVKGRLLKSTLLM